jgi:hypothetical protein
MTPKKMLAVFMSTLLLAGLGQAALASENSTNLPKQIAKTKKEYFALYNQLNTNPQFEMVCRRVFGELTCKPRYFMEARQKAKKVCSAGGVYPEPGVGYIYISSESCRIDRNKVLSSAAEQEVEFQRNVVQVFQRSPELQSLGLKLEELQGRQRSAKN